MEIAIVGTGYVGLVTGECFAEMGINVTCIDMDESKIAKLNNGIIPIYEPNLDNLVKRNTEAGRLRFIFDLASVIDEVEIIFSAVGTPPDEDGSADLKYVLEVAKTIGKNMNKYLVVVTKSTVPVGTAVKVKNAIQKKLNKRNVKIEFDVAYNPEFLKEGNAIEDFMKPDIYVGNFRATFFSIYICPIAFSVKVHFYSIYHINFIASRHYIFVNLNMLQLTIGEISTNK